MVGSMRNDGRVGGMDRNACADDVDVGTRRHGSVSGMVGYMLRGGLGEVEIQIR